MMGMGTSRADGDCGMGVNHMTSFAGVTWLDKTRWNNDILTVSLKEIMKCCMCFSRSCPLKSLPAQL